MRPQPSTLLALLAGASLARAHSWIEEIYRISPSGAFTGDPGYARGWIPRDSKDPLWTDTIPTYLLPYNGQSAYSGEEILNKFDFNPNPAFPMLQAAPGDYIALQHLENGHTTLPANQPDKPLNRGTIYIYGTADPKPKERLFDVHLKWNRAGTGGDKRGRLLAAGNYDDGQCFQPNPSEIGAERVKTLAAEGAEHAKELRCQSDIQLPEDLKPGSIYTLYWYWDWPDLLNTTIDMAATKNGKFPWAGTFMRGETDPNGFTMAAIKRNESYSSVADIKIIEPAKLPGGAAVAKAAAGWQSGGNVYTQAIKAQMTSNFQVDVDANGASGGAPTTPASTPATAAPSSANPAAPSGTSSSGLTLTTTVTMPPATPTNGDVTVTETVTVPPSTVISTVYVTASATPDTSVNGRSQPNVYASSLQYREEPVETVTEIATCVATVTKKVPAAGASAAPARARMARRGRRLGQ